MIRGSLNNGREHSPEGFRYRGVDTTRLEALTDTVFGFSITLLVVSLEVPKTYVELQASMYSFIGFVFCAMLLLSIWNNHYVFFLKYGIEDKLTKTLNFVLLFLLLFYVYPLKYLFNYVGTWFWLELRQAMGDRSDGLQLGFENLRQAEMMSWQWADLMLNFGVGLFAIELIFYLWYRNAYKKRALLELNEYEVEETRHKLSTFVIKLGVPVLSMLIILIFGGEASGYAGMVYMLIPTLTALHRRRWKNKLAKSAA